MNVVGIIAEYNPFHQGHAYQIRTLKEICHADYTVIAMSGNFVQRGAQIGRASCRERVYVSV